MTRFPREKERERETDRESVRNKTFHKTITASMNTFKRYKMKKIWEVIFLKLSLDGLRTVSKKSLKS